MSETKQPPKLEYHRGFFSSPGGGKLSFDSSLPVFYTLVTLVFITLILLWLFKRQIKEKYDNSPHKYLFFKSEKALNMTVGISILIFFFFRVAILSTGQFINKWEIIPLHLCRLNIFLIGIILLFNKPKYIKYIAFASIGGALIGLALPDLRFPIKEPFVLYDIDGSSRIIEAGPDKKNWFYLQMGFDNYFFYDYLAAHIFILSTPIIFWILRGEKISFKDALIIWGFLVGLIIVAFIVNSITDTYVPKKLVAWRTNYLYNGINEINARFSAILPPLTSWPYMVITQVVLATIIVPLFILFYLLQDKLKVSIQGKKVVFKTGNSETYEYFKSTLPKRAVK